MRQRNWPAFRVPDVQHYLIVDPDQRLVIHHERGEGTVVTTRIMHEGSIRLDPPGIELAIVDFYAT